MDDVSFTVRAGDKVGLVGRNGAGKTSMLKVLGGDAPPAFGVVHRQGLLGYLNQEPRRRDDDEARPALDHVLGGRGLDEERERLEKLRLRVEEDPSERNVVRFTRAEDRYRETGGYVAEPEARRIVAGLGLGGDRVDMPLGVLSGGERRRVELARILFAGSDVLLLDEPTNHLDNDAKTWLMNFLRTYRGALLVVSHDLELLDESITRVLHLDGGSLVEYKGTYSAYRAARKRDEERQARLAKRQQAEIDRLATLADSLRHSTVAMARKAKSLDTRVERMRTERVDDVKRERTMRVRLPEPPHAGRVVIEAAGVAKAYGSRLVLDDLSFHVERGERLLVLGLNGAGKTTLLRILAGVTEADTGEVTLGHGVHLGYYAQEHEGIRAGADVLSHLREASAVDAGDQPLRQLAGMFGLSGEIAFQDASTLSGGEKTKLALAQLVAGRTNLVLLDEPTNNLDPPSRDAIAAALSSWTGSMIVVSHDAGFVELLEPDRVLLLPDGTLDYWSDDLIELVELA